MKNLISEKGMAYLALGAVGVVAIVYGQAEIVPGCVFGMVLINMLNQYA